MGLYILKCNVFLWCKAVFPASFLQSSVSHDLQKLFKYADLLLKKHFWLSSMLKTVVLLITFAETMINISIYFKQNHVRFSAYTHI